MRSLFFFLLVFVAAFLFGAVLAYPANLVFSSFTDAPFHKIISKTTLFSGLIFSLLYLRAYNLLSTEGLGWHSNQNNFLKHIGFGFLAGLVLLLLIILSKLLLGIYQPDADADLGLQALIILVIKAMITGIFVSVIEETIFRGALFTGIGKQTNMLIALFVTSLIYAAVHYLKFRALPPGTDINWFTGVTMIPIALFRFSDPVIIDSFLTIFVLGILFGLMRMRTGNIIQCLGFHIGIVATLRVTSYLTDYARGSGWDFMVNKYEHQFGYLTTAYLLAAIVIYYLLVMRKKPENPAKP